MRDISALKNFTILYVEDDDEALSIVSDILKSCFKEVYSANNGVVGLALYKEHLPDIVLSDIQMPKMNGIEMTRKIRQIDPNQQIALFTAFNEVEYLKDSVNLGVSKYILKPLEEQQFFTALLEIAKVLQSDVNTKNIEHILEVQSKISAIGEMLGNIAHQWRQPLSVITTHVSALKVSYELGMEVKKEDITNCIDGVMNQAQYLSSTIDDFREFFKADTKTTKDHNLNDIIKRLNTLTKSAYDSNFITLKTNIDKEIVINTNENILIQALINIVNNSKDAIVENTKKSSDRYFILETHKKEGEVTLTLKDSGGGIKDEIIDKIFEPYFTTKHPSVGTGIGLYMTHQIITKHLKGKISVSNVDFQYEGKVLRGAEFIITLPLD